MKMLNLIILFFAIIPKICFCQDSLCEHVTDGNVKAKEIKITVKLPCDWNLVESKSPSQIFKYLKHEAEVNLISSSSLTISELPVGLTPVEEKELIKLNGLKMLSAESGEIVSSKSLIINNIKGGQIIRKDIANKYYKIYNYFIYKKKLITIAYFIIFNSELNISNYFKTFDNYLTKTTFR